MKNKNILGTVLFCLLFAFSCSAMAQMKYSSEWVKENYIKKELDIRMRDGILLHTIIYEPKDESVRHPVLMERTCYTISPYGEENYQGLTSYAPYVDAGYIFVFQDVRGKNMSEGEYDDIRPFIENKMLYKKESKNVGQTDEASDTYDTVEWVVNNTNNNGCVGVKGISYPGFYATMAALSGHPAVKAVSPQAPVTDWYHGDDVHHNGAFMLAEMVSFQPFFEYMMNNKYVRNRKSGRPDFKFPELIKTDIYTDYLKLGTYSNICRAYADSLEYLRTVREHPDWDGYWQSHTVTEGHLHDVKPAVMVVGGLFDKEDCYGAFSTYKSIKEQSPSTDLYLVEGPWYHGAWTRGMTPFWASMYFGPEATSEYYMSEIEYPFFAYYLEDKGEKPASGARVFDSGSRRWNHYEDGWPVLSVGDTVPFYLHADGSVSSAVSSAEGIVSYVSDPVSPVPYRSKIETSVSKDYMIDDQRFASQRPDVVCFGSEVLEKPLTLAGEMEVELSVDISTTDADFVVKLIDVFPDGFSWYEELGIGGSSSAGQGVRVPDYAMGGYQLMVRGEVMRGKYRESFSRPVPFEPGRTTKVSFTMPDISHTFLPGHRLMVQVQSSWFPLVDRNPQTFCNIYTCDESAYVKTEVNIHCDGSAPSLIRLPVVK